MPNMVDDPDAKEAIDELYEGPGPDGFDDLMANWKFTGTFAVVKLVVDRVGGGCHDGRKKEIRTEQRGTGNLPPIADAIKAAEDEVDRLKSCTTQACYANPNARAHALGFRVEKDGVRYYAVVAYIPADGVNAGRTRIRQAFQNPSCKFKLLNYNDDKGAVEDSCP